MLILLPPSESKREGGDARRPLDLTALAFPELTAARERAVAALVGLAADPDHAAATLKLGPTLRHEIGWNASLRGAPTMPALDRYDGVLFDALDAGSLPRSARTFAARHLGIASALFGITGALDPIPAYRISAGSRLPGEPLGALWRAPLRELLAARRGLLLDLRSHDYAALGPLPDRPDAVAVRVVSEGADGRLRALNHFNKHGKGVFVRQLLLAGERHRTVDDLLRWAAAAGVRLERGEPGFLDLVV